MIDWASVAWLPLAEAQTNGRVRYNTGLSKFEGDESGSWTNLVPRFQHSEFTASGTFTTPSGTSTKTVYKFTVVGGGGGGRIGGNRCGGSAGGAAIYWGTGVPAGTNVTVTVGAGGAVGANGGSSSIVFNGTTVTANGGALAASTNCVAGGTATGGHINIQGGTGGMGGTDQGTGGGTIFGNGGGGGADATKSSGADGRAYGSGGGSSPLGAATAGAGAGGIVLIEWMQ